MFKEGKYAILSGELVSLTNRSELVSLAQRGDKQAFEQLVQLYQNRVFSHCIKLSGNRDDAQDLAQEVFVQAYRSLKSFRREADFGTWLHKVTINIWINANRRHKLVTFSLDEPVSTEDGDITREVAASEDSPLERIEQEETLGLVRKSLMNLAPEFRAVLVLRDMEGYSYEEIAKFLDCSLGTIKSRLNRARKYIRDDLLKHLNRQPEDT